MTNSISEIEDSGCIFVIGSNTTACHPLIASEFSGPRKSGAKLIVADPRTFNSPALRTWRSIQRLGSDVALLNGMMHIIIENGWHLTLTSPSEQKTYEVEHEGDGIYPEKVQGDYRNQHRIWKNGGTLRHPSTASLLYAMGITQHTTGVDNVKSCCNLAMLCGNVGVHGGGVNPLRGQNNVQGACDMGGLPNVMTGYQPVADPHVLENSPRHGVRRFPTARG
jgi:predicted molibdopterin-dependent oxidoreductase YjgC